MAINPAFASLRLVEGHDSQPYARFALTAMALVLALVLGFSAIDIQSQRAADIYVSNGVSEQEPISDGRGKWGGYL